MSTPLISPPAELTLEQKQNLTAADIEDALKRLRDGIVAQVKLIQRAIENNRYGLTKEQVLAGYPNTDTLVAAETELVALVNKYAPGTFK